MGTKIFLGFSVALWLPYGVTCIFFPGYLGEVAGVVGSTATGTTEIRAMYGGLQAAIGVICLTALLRPELALPTLCVLALLTGGLALARGIGLAIDGGATGYTLGAIGFEIANTAVATTLLRRRAAERVFEGCSQRP